MVVPAAAKTQASRRGIAPAPDKSQRSKDLSSQSKKGPQVAPRSADPPPAAEPHLPPIGSAVFADGEEAVPHKGQEDGGMEPLIERVLNAGEMVSEAMVADRNLPEEFLEDASGSAIEAALAQLTHLRLDRENLVNLGPALRPYLPNLTNLYLQHNRLRSLNPDIALARRLRFLTVAHNQLESLEGLGGLPQLLLLDASHNRIEDLCPSEDLPRSLAFLSLEGNPCWGREGPLREEVLSSLPALRELDGAAVSRTDSSEGSEEDEEAASVAHDQDGEKENKEEAAGALSEGTCNEEEEAARLRAVLHLKLDGRTLPALDPATVTARQTLHRGRDRIMARSRSRILKDREEEKASTVAIQKLRASTEAVLRSSQALHAAALRRLEASHLETRPEPVT